MSPGVRTINLPTSAASERREEQNVAVKNDFFHGSQCQSANTERMKPRSHFDFPEGCESDLLFHRVAAHILHCRIALMFAPGRALSDDPYTSLQINKKRRSMMSNCSGSGGLWEQKLFIPSACAGIKGQMCCQLKQWNRLFSFFFLLLAKLFCLKCWSIVFLLKWTKVIFFFFLIFRENHFKWWLTGFNSNFTFFILSKLHTYIWEKREKNLNAP